MGATMDGAVSPNSCCRRDKVAVIGITKIGEKSRLHSLTAILANEWRKLVLSPVLNT